MDSSTICIGTTEQNDIFNQVLKVKRKEEFFVWLFQKLVRELAEAANELLAINDIYKADQVSNTKRSGWVGDQNE